MSTQVLGDVQLVTKQEVEAMLDEVVTPESAIDSKVDALKTYVDEQNATLKELYEAADTALEAKINAEVVERTNKDAALAQSVTNEATLREQTDNALQTRIEREEGVRATADEQIITLVESEASERKAADLQLEQNIELLSQKIDPAVSQLTALIAAEEEKRIAADEVLTAAVDANKVAIEEEATTREEADTALGERIDHLKDTKNDSFEDKVYCARLENLPLAQMTIENLDKTIAVGDIIGSVSAEYFPKIPVTFSMVSVVDTGSGTDGYAYLVLRLDAAGNVNVINKTVLSAAFEGNINSATVMYITKE